MDGLPCSCDSKLSEVVPGKVKREGGGGEDGGGRVDGVRRWKGSPVL